MHARASRFERSLADAERALEEEPRHFGALAVRAASLRGLRRYEEALHSYDATLDAHPGRRMVV